MTNRSEQENAKNAGEARLVRNPDILERQVGDTVFLVNPVDDTIFYLNPLSAGIWNLLADPTTPSEAERIVQLAFPNVPPNQIAADVSELIRELERKDLARRYD